MNNLCQEKEYKILISEKQYREINNKIIWDKSYAHINYYYDTDDLQLYKRGVTCRIRKCEGHFKLQKKYPDTSKNKLYKTKIESEDKINDAPPLLMVDGQLLIRLGSLSTYRKEKLLTKDVVLFLDRNNYFEQTDYELEIEFNAEDVMIEEILEELNIKITAKPKGKKSRFIDGYLKR